MASAPDDESAIALLRRKLAEELSPSVYGMFVQSAQLQIDDKNRLTVRCRAVFQAAQFKRIVSPLIVSWGYTVDVIVNHQ